MASKGQVSILFSIFVTVLLSFPSLHAADDNCASPAKIAVYWGDKSDEGTLKEACDTNNYAIVILKFLRIYEYITTKTPILGINSVHCDHRDCTALEQDIKHCQSKNIQVLLSISIDPRQLEEIPPDVGKRVADYLLDNFLSGKHGPLGSVTLDGINLSGPEGTKLHWDVIARFINGTTQHRKIYLSASAQCDFFQTMSSVIGTHLLDYIWIQFYGRSECEYVDGNSLNLLKKWQSWISDSAILPNNSVFLEATASETSSGYIPPQVLKSDILPTLKKASNYGGVMIENRSSDRKSKYSDQIKDGSSRNCKLKCVCDDDQPVSASFYGLLSQY